MVNDLFGPSLWGGLITMLTIVVMETMLSVDNAAVLAIMVRGLPEEQQPKALKYGIVGAFVLRGVCLVFVSLLIRMWYLKILGGVWLVWLFIKHFKGSEGEEEDGQTNPVFKFFLKYVSLFWATVVLVETMDLMFSMDNIFAVTAMTSYMGWIVIGVSIGIVGMRFIAQKFVKLMEKFPFLENVAFVVIFMLGIKLLLTGYTHYNPETSFAKALESKAAEYVTSSITILTFFAPVLTSILFGIPKRGKPESDSIEEEAKPVLETEV